MNTLNNSLNLYFPNPKKALSYTVLCSLAGALIGAFIANNIGHYYSAKILVQLGTSPNPIITEPNLSLEPVSKIRERLLTRSYTEKIASKIGPLTPQQIDKIKDSISVKELKTRGLIEIQVNTLTEKMAKDYLTEITADILTKHQVLLDEAIPKAKKYLSVINGQIQENARITNLLLSSNKLEENKLALNTLIDDQKNLKLIQSKLEFDSFWGFTKSEIFAETSVSKDLYWTNLKTYTEVGIILGLIIGLMFYYFDLNRRSN